MCRSWHNSNRMRRSFVSLRSVPHRAFLISGPIGSTGTGLTSAHYCPHDLHESMIRCTSRSAGFSDTLPWRMTVSIQCHVSLELVTPTEGSTAVKCAYFKLINWLFIFFHSWRCYWYLHFLSQCYSRLLKIAPHETNNGINMQSGLIWFQLFLYLSSLTLLLINYKNRWLWESFGLFLLPAKSSASEPCT